MGIIKKEDMPQSKLEIEPNLDLPNELPDTCNFQYNEVKKTLNEFIEAYQKYLYCKDHIDHKKATLLIQTDWSVALPEHSRPTVGDKEAYINDVTYNERVKSRELYLDKLLKEELYKLELLRYEKE